jgi:hypothetical protein
LKSPAANSAALPLSIMAPDAIAVRPNLSANSPPMTLPTPPMAITLKARSPASAAEWPCSSSAATRNTGIQVHMA